MLKKRNQTYAEIKAQINTEDIEHYYRMFNVTSPRDLMLCVIFNMLHSIKYKEDGQDPEALEVLKTQRAIFELACQHSRGADVPPS